MDSTGTSLDTIDNIKHKSEWPAYLRACAARMDDISKMTSLPRNVRDLKTIAAQMARLADQLDNV